MTTDKALDALRSLVEAVDVWMMEDPPDDQPEGDTLLMNARLALQLADPHGTLLDDLMADAALGRQTRLSNERRREWAVVDGKLYSPTVCSACGRDYVPTLECPACGTDASDCDCEPVAALEEQS